MFDVMKVKIVFLRNYGISQVKKYMLEFFFLRFDWKYQLLILPQQ